LSAEEDEMRNWTLIGFGGACTSCAWCLRFVSCGHEIGLLRVTQRRPFRPRGKNASTLVTAPYFLPFIETTALPCPVNSLAHLANVRHSTSYERPPRRREGPAWCTSDRLRGARGPGPRLSLRSTVPRPAANFRPSLLILQLCCSKMVHWNEVVARLVAAGL